MNRKCRFSPAICAFIFLPFLCPHATADDCTLGKAWDVLVVGPYVSYYGAPVEVCFYQNGTVFVCDPWNKIFYGFAAIFPQTSCVGDRTTVYNTWLWNPEGLFDAIVSSQWGYLKEVILYGDTLFFGWGMVPGEPWTLFILSHGAVRDYCMCSLVCLDGDMDGYGFPANEACTYPEEDCDRFNPNVNPGAREGPEGDPTCSDTVDNDCDGSTDLDDIGCSPS